MAAPKLSRELFLPGLFVVEIKTHICSVGLMKFSEMSMMSSDFILISQNVVILDLSQSALPSIPSVPLPPLESSAVLPTVSVLYVCMYVCMSVYIHMCTCQVCIKASSIQLTMEKGGAFFL